MKNKYMFALMLCAPSVMHAMEHNKTDTSGTLYLHLKDTATKRDFFTGSVSYKPDNPASLQQADEKCDFTNNPRSSSNEHDLSFLDDEYRVKLDSLTMGENDEQNKVLKMLYSIIKTTKGKEPVTLKQETLTLQVTQLLLTGYTQKIECQSLTPFELWMRIR